MNFNPKAVMLCGLCFTVILVSVLLLSGSGMPRAKVHTAIVYDRSKSPRDGCEAVKILLWKALSFSQQRRTPLSITLFATGDRESSYEPVPIKLPVVPKPTGRVLEGKGRFVEVQRQFVEDSYGACEQLSRTEISPIFLSVKRAVEYVRALDSRSGVELHVLAQTDLEENVEADIKRAIHTGSGASTRLPPKIDNAGVSVDFCGYSDTSSEYTDSQGHTQRATPLRNARNADRLLEVWRSLFTHPELVTFNPICTKD
jgi:hypothetical protein